MHGDELFPIKAVPSRVRMAILREFQGRHPSIQEVKRISDRQWLATPGVGPAVLELIRRVTESQHWGADTPAPSEIKYDELLERLEFVQDELRSISRLLKARLAQPKPSRSVRATLQPHL